MKVEILDEAIRDLKDGPQFYDAQLDGLGAYFLDTLFSDIDSLRLFAGIHAVQYDYHRLLSRRFPYAIYYRIEINIVRVRRVLDCRRNPAYIQEGLA